MQKPKNTYTCLQCLLLMTFQGLGLIHDFPKLENLDFKYHDFLKSACTLKNYGKNVIYLTLATNTWLVILARSMPSSCSSCMLKSLDIVAALPIMPRDCVDICDTGPIPVAGRDWAAATRGAIAGFNNRPPEPMYRRLNTSSSFSYQHHTTQCHEI